jgi:hypothetical protein
MGNSGALARNCNKLIACKLRQASAPPKGLAGSLPQLRVAETDNALSGTKRGSSTRRVSGIISK